jgi:DNA-binding transcriptional MerR regulator
MIEDSLTKVGPSRAETLTMQTYSTGDVRAITGIPTNTFERWCHDGVVQADGGGNGHGNHRRFTRMQVVGIVVADALRKAEQGCALKYIAQIVDAFSATTEPELLKQFDKGNTHFVIVHLGLPLLRPQDYPHWIDVQRAYRKVVRAAEAMEAERAARMAG